MHHGVPQGSVLGPLLFILYINDLPQALNYLIPILFADDTNLFHKGTSYTTLFNEVNNDLKHLNEWFMTNKLSLNVEKNCLCTVWQTQCT